MEGEVAVGRHAGFENRMPLRGRVQLLLLPRNAVISGETTTGGANTAPVRSLGANECGVRLPPLRRTDVVQQQDIGLRANAFASTLLARVTDGPTLEAYLTPMIPVRLRAPVHMPPLRRWDARLRSSLAEVQVLSVVPLVLHRRLVTDLDSKSGA